ncbi:MAG: inositol monophosphatase [Pseudomonadota bacterium]
MPIFSKLNQIMLDVSRIGQDWSQKRSELILDEKSAGDFATNADIDVEHYLRAALAEKFPGQPVLGEEFGGDLSPDQTGWVIDPIDGTSNFALGLPIWGISVGYIVEGKSVMGAISLPDLDIIVSAEAGKGIRLNNREIQAQKFNPAIMVIGLGENDFETGQQTDARAEKLRQDGYAVVRYRCAVFSLAMSALGRLSGYVENGCCLWDVAAADVICREAGLQVETAKIADGRYSIDARWVK